MDNRLDCAIVRDLLPSYADGLCSDTTNRAIEEHLADCPDCAEALRLMREPALEKEPPAPEVDYLKKVRRRSTGRSVVIGIALMLIGMALLFFRVFYVGGTAGEDDVFCRVTVSGDTVSVSGTLTSSGLGVSRVTFSDSNGMVRMTVYTVPKAFWNSGEFTAEYTAGCDVGQVRVGDLILWEDGAAVSNTAARLFRAVNPFVGDMSSNAAIASILGVSDQLGPYTNELQTDSEPYGWTLCLETGIARDDETAARDIMTADSYVMLAAVGNLGYVTWEYQVGGSAREYTVTAEDASGYAGRDIRECARSASDLQALLESLSIKWAGVRQTSQETGAFCLNVTNGSDAEIFALEMDYYIDGELVGTRGVANADGSALKPGDTLVFDFASDNLPADTSAISLATFSFDLYAIDDAGGRMSVCEDMTVYARYSWSYSYLLTGDPASGFALAER